MNLAIPVLQPVLFYHRIVFAYAKQHLYVLLTKCDVLHSL